MIQLSGVERRGGRNVVASAGRRQDPPPPALPPTELAVPYGIALGMTTLVLLVLKLGNGALEEADAWAGVGGLGAGDVAGAFLWSVSLWYCSPVQLLLLFLGKIETTRPSDWVLRQLGTAAKLDVDAIDYVAPLPLQAATVLAVVAGGVATSFAFQALLGDATWAISTGIGALVAAAVYEVGRPDRLSVDEAQALEAQWQDFAAFAEGSLARSGRCHESEVFRSFRARHARYRTEDAASDSLLRDMVRNWHGGAERSRAGWYKNLSVRPRGGGPPAAESPPPAAAAAGGEAPGERATSEASGM